ncbi:hypothetical protein EYR40_004848 [Pleurotus pulmonarius]|nr:hypothetical protein EYR36_006771 [Pleurotus pulmonarius]KAF4601649.1 hypothetical protein EYR40_004848 [Pleurotus pulmonarius]
MITNVSQRAIMGEQSHERNLEIFRAAMQGGGEGDIFYAQQEGGIAGGFKNRNTFIESEGDISSRIKDMQLATKSNLDAGECATQIAESKVLEEEIKALLANTVGLLQQFRTRRAELRQKTKS